MLTCPLCQRPTTATDLIEINWQSASTIARLASLNPGWKREDGACPVCVQDALLHTLLSQGDNALHRHVQSVWPLDAETAFGAMPMPLRLHADPRFHGRGVIIALIDSGFYPHPDLVEPTNRVRAWVNAAADPVEVHPFAANEQPQWPEWNSLHGRQWHGTMTSTVAAGNGQLSHSFYRGLASEAQLILIQTRTNHISLSDAALLRALRWLEDNAQALGVYVWSIFHSVANR